MAIGAIIVTSLSYASQLLSAESICNAEWFNNKVGPFVGSIMETILLMQMVMSQIVTKQGKFHMTNSY